VSQSYETIVLGLGAVGSAALYHLAGRANKVLGIDQFDPPHALGSSHGETRITRQAIGEGVQYTPVVLRSYEIVRAMEKESNADLLVITGGLMISSPGSGGIHNTPDFFKNMLEAAEKYSIKHDKLDAADIRKRFPQFRVQDNEVAYYEYQSGLLYAERCIDVQLKLAAARGAQINKNERVLSFTQASSGVKVVTDRAEYFAEQLVVSAGPWLSQFVPPALSEILQVQRQVQFWFDIQNCYEDFAVGKFPIFIWEMAGSSDSMYGFPAVDGPTGGFKIGCASYNQIVTPDSIDRNVSGTEMQAVFAAQIQPFFPAAVGPCVKSKVCLYTTTPDSDFIIDRLPGQPSVLICSPCSGHGFKHSAAIGEGIAEIVMDGKAKLDFSSFKMDRLAVKV